MKSVEYDVPVFNENAYDFRYGTANNDWWDGNIETSKRSAFQKAIIEKASTGAINVYGDDGKLLSAKDVDLILSHKETLRYQQTLPPFQQYDTVISGKLFYGDIQYLRFREQWSYDAKTFKITKQITGYAPVWVEYDQNNKKTGKTKALFWIHYSDSEKKNYQPLTDLISYNLPLFAVIDQPQFINLFHCSNDTMLRKQYVDSLTHYAENNKVKIYDCNDIEGFFNDDQDSISALKKEGAFFKFNDIDSMTLTRNDPPYETYDTVILKSLDRYKIIGLKFFEKWMIDGKTLEIKKEILGFTTLIDIFDYDEKFTGMQKLFYFSFDKPTENFKLK